MDEVPDWSFKGICWIFDKSWADAFIDNVIQTLRHVLACMGTQEEVSGEHQGVSMLLAVSVQGLKSAFPGCLWPNQALQKGLELQYRVFLAANLILQQPQIPWNWPDISTGSNPRHKRREKGLRRRTQDHGQVISDGYFAAAFLSDHWHLPHTPAASIPCP